MTFRAIVGHRRIKSLLSGAVGRGSIPPTLLFAGPPGVGKALAAGATAAALNCLSPLRDTEGLPFDACGTCRSCDRITRGVHVDVVHVTPDERASIKIDVIRDTLQPTAYRPFEGKRRVVIIGEADALEHSAQNALLKSLEEPPPGTIFILVTAVPHALLPTVLSRCMRLRFGRLTGTEVADVLTRDHNLSADEAQDAAALADGSVGQALDLASVDLGVMRDVAMRLLQLAARTPAVQSRLQAAPTLWVDPSRKGREERPRAEVGLILRMIASMVRDIALLHAGGDRRVLANPTLAEPLGALTRAYGGERARDAFSAVVRAMTAVDPPRNAGPKVVADWLASRI